MSGWCCRHPRQLGQHCVRFFLVGISQFYYSEIGEGYGFFLPTKPTLVSVILSQLPLPWAFFSALCILRVDEATLEQRTQLTIQLGPGDKNPQTPMESYSVGSCSQRPGCRAWWIRTPCSHMGESACEILQPTHASGAAFSSATKIFPSIHYTN